MSDITPAGYIYGRDPKQTNLFWDIGKVDEKTLQDERWLGIEDFPENYSVSIDVNKVENKTRYDIEITNALYQKEIDYLTIENSNSNRNYIGTANSGKIFTLKNSRIASNNYLFTTSPGYHKIIFDNCNIGEESSLRLWWFVEIAPHSHIVELNNVRMSQGSTITARLEAYSPGAFLNDSCLILKWNINSDIYIIYNDSSLTNIKRSNVKIFIEDEKIPTYLANSRWSQLASQIRPLSEFHEEDW